MRRTPGRSSASTSLGTSARLRALILLCLSALLARAAFGQDADARAFIDDSGVPVQIPTSPERIVTLHDHTLTVPLLELGVTPVGSHGRLAPDGEPFIRSALTLTGTDFANSAIEFVGNGPADVERIAALAPDLILTTEWDATDVEQLRRIAPTAVFDDTQRGRWGIVAALAEITGTVERHQRMEKRYAAQVALIREMIDTESISVSTVHTDPDGGLFAYNPYGNIGRVLKDAGFSQPAVIEAIPMANQREFNAERLLDFDADFIVTTYRSSAGDTPEDVRGYFEQIVPGYCKLLHACRENQMLLVSRAEAIANSYHALGSVAYMILSEIGGRPFVPMAR